jgi:hypothetical protein
MNSATRKQGKNLRARKTFCGQKLLRGIQAKQQRRFTNLCTAGISPVSSPVAKGETKCELIEGPRRSVLIAGAIEGLVRHLRPEFDDEDERRMVATAAVEQFMLRVMGMARSWEQMFAEEVAKAMQRKVAA